MGEPAVRAPPFLDCRAEFGFDPSWDKFRELASWSARRGWPLDPQLAFSAAQILERFDDVSMGRSWGHPASATWESFRTAGGRDDAPMLPPDLQVLPIRGVPRGQSVIVENTLVGDRGPSCLYGLVTALFVAYRHGVPRPSEDAPRHLELILWLLGETEGGEQLFDFLESSSWPVRSIDVEANLELAKTGAPRFVRFTSLRVAPPAAATTRASPAPPARPLPRFEARRALGLAVFGVHGATSMEPASAIRRAWRAARGASGEAKFAWRFYGHPCPSYALTSYLCRWKAAMLPGSAGARADGIAELLADMVDTSEAHVERPWDVHGSLGRVARAVRDMDDGFARRADLWLCGGPAVLCALLHVADPRKAMIVWHCRHLLDGLSAIPNSTQTALLMGLRTMAASAGHVVIVACEAFASMQAAWQLSLPPPPVHQRLALYVRHVAWTGASSSDVLVLRSMIWSRLPGLYFKTLVGAFVRENQEWFHLNFIFASEESSGFLAYTDVARHRCAILVPNDLTMASFVETFSMGMPIFVPKSEWMYRLQKSVPFGFMVHNGQLPLSCDSCGFDKHLPPFWQEKRRAFSSVLHWLQISDFARWPHVQRFGSIPELLRGLARMDPAEVSSAMQAWMQEMTEQVMRQWHSVLAAAVGESSEAAAPSAPAPEVARQQSGDARPRQAPCADVLYAGLACEHASFESAGWPAFRAALEAAAERDFDVADAAAGSAAHAAGRAVLSALPGVSDEFVLLSNEAFSRFLRAAAPGGGAETCSEGIVARLAGHCHLGTAAALLLRAREELSTTDRPEVVTQAVRSALALLAPLNEHAARDETPAGAWPIDELLGLVSALMDRRGGGGGAGGGAAP